MEVATACGVKFGVDPETLQCSFVVVAVASLAFAQQAAKLFTEMQSNQKASSDAFTATAVQITPMLDRGLFQSVEWSKLLPGRITPNIVEADGRALRVLTQMPGILYNKQKLPEVAKITAMEDLLKNGLIP